MKEVAALKLATGPAVPNTGTKKLGWCIVKRFREFVDKWISVLLLMIAIVGCVVWTFMIAFECVRVAEDVNEITRETVAEVTTNYLESHWGE